jgi:predicted molibdopterin-dependent oxidoreductase YjgC
VITIKIDGKSVEVDAGTNLAAALLNSGVNAFRNSVTTEPRQPLCAMGICFECRVTIEGEPHQRSCLIPVREGMNVTTSG